MALGELPTEPFTVIRVHYFDPPWDSELILLPDGQWWTPGATSPARAETLPMYITEFEVIAKPADPDHFEAEDPISARVRRDTAKAVLGRVMEIGIPNDGLGTVRAAIRDEVADIARAYAVEL
jgi:hypothetical protein